MGKGQKYRTIVFYKDHFEDFFLQQRQRVRDKIIWTLELIEDLEKVPESYLKHLESTKGLYEVRVQAGNEIFRIFCFFDTGKQIVVVNGFQKKTQKTPPQELQKALRIKQLYESEKT